MSKRKRTSYSGRKPRSAASFASSRRQHLGKKKQFTAKQAFHIKEILKESKKWQDCSLDDTALTTLMTEMPMTLPSGNGQFYWIGQTDVEDNNRNGDTIRGTTMDIRGTLKTKYQGTTTCRLMLVQWAQNANHDIREVLNDYQQPAGTSYSNNVVNSFRKMNGTQPYNVLWDKKIRIGNAQVLPTGGTFPIVTKDFRIYVKLTPKQSKMTYGLPQPGGPVKNPIFLYACYADTTGVTALAPQLEYTARIRYVDV